VGHNRLVDMHLEALRSSVITASIMSRSRGRLENQGPVRSGAWYTGKCSAQTLGHFVYKSKSVDQCMLPVSPPVLQSMLLDERS